MDTRRPGPPGETDELLPQAAAGDAAALARLLARHRKRLRQMVRLRLDRRIQGRVDPPTSSRKPRPEGALTNQIPGATPRGPKIFRGRIRLRWGRGGHEDVEARQPVRPDPG